MQEYDDVYGTLSVGTIATLDDKPRRKKKFPLGFYTPEQPKRIQVKSNVEQPQGLDAHKEASR